MEGRDAMDAYVEELLDLRASAKFLWPIPDTGVGRRLGRIDASAVCSRLACVAVRLIDSEVDQRH